MQIKVGDVFTAIITDDKLAIGQILQKNRGDIYVVFFNKLYSHPFDPSKVEIAIKEKPVILARTLTTFFKLNRWIVIANKPVQSKAEYYPNYKIETLEGVYIINFDRQPIRRASKVEEDFYTFHNSVTGAYVVGALKAYHGIIPMDHSYYKLTYDFISKRSNTGN